MVPGRGLEPLRIAPPDPKSGASANFATLVSANANTFPAAARVIDSPRNAHDFATVEQRIGDDVRKLSV